MSEPFENARMVLRTLFGWDWFPGPPRDYDRRRRTTKTLKEFSSFANKLVLFNAVLLLYGYFAFLYPAVYADIPEIFRHVLPARFDWFTLARTWFQAQLLVVGLDKLYDRLDRIAFADH